MKKPFGRAWRFPNKAQCEFHAEDRDKTLKALGSDINLLNRYQRWASYMGLKTLLPNLIGRLSTYPTYDLEFPKTSVTVWERK
jgi:hypothetical protein